MKQLNKFKSSTVLPGTNLTEIMDVTTRAMDAVTQNLASIKESLIDQSLSEKFCDLGVIESAARKIKGVPLHLTLVKERES